MSYMMGIDVGTTGTRVVIVRPDGHVVGAATGDHQPMRMPKPGWAEQDPADWWNATIKAVRAALAPFLPAPIVVRDRSGTFRLDTDRPKSIGRVRSFFGNVGVLLRAYCYLRTLGPEGVRRVAENAVLNANYLLARVKGVLDVPYGDRCMHELVASAARLKAERGIRAMDIAKRLLDYGFHAPTVYFPLVVREAMMIEPTETESKATLDAMADAIARIIEESPDLLSEAPHTGTVSRPDEVRAARNPLLRDKDEG